MVTALYFTANKIITKSAWIYDSAHKLERTLYTHGFDMRVELAESATGVVTAEVRSRDGEAFDAAQVERILFPKRNHLQLPMYN